MEVQKAGTTIAKYGHNAFGQRVWKEVSGEKTYFYYTEDGLSGEFDAGGGLIRGYLYEPNRGFQMKPLAMKMPSGAFYYYITDHLGTPQALIDKNMKVVGSGKYRAFGEASAVVNKVENPLRFPGQYYDEETGLHQNYMREYDQRLGAYTSQDPVGVFVTGANRYGYVRGNPVHLADSRGEMPNPGELTCPVGGPANPLCDIGIAIDVGGWIIFAVAAAEVGDQIGKSIPKAECPPRSAEDRLCDYLRDQVKKYCKTDPDRGRSCADLGTFMSREEALSNAEKFEKCAEARLSEMILCFGGGDEGHLTRVDEEMRSAERCRERAERGW